MTLGILLALILGAYALSYMIMHSLARASAKSYFVLRLMLLPGIMLHEIAHAVACFITGTPIHTISFWDEQGGHVLHSKPRFPIVTQPIISFAPFPAGIAALLALSNYTQDYTWWVTAIAIFLMVSVAATLAPSKADFVPALEGTLLFALLAGVLFYFVPSTLAAITPTLESFNIQLVTVNVILLIIWAGISATHRTVRHLTHR